MSSIERNHLWSRLQHAVADQADEFVGQTVDTAKLAELVIGQGGGHWLARVHSSLIKCSLRSIRRSEQSSSAAISGFE